MSKFLPGLYFFVWSSFLKDCLFVVCLSVFEGRFACRSLAVPRAEQHQEGSRLPCLWCQLCQGSWVLGLPCPRGQNTQILSVPCSPAVGTGPDSPWSCTFVSTLVICICSGIRDGAENIPVGKVSFSEILCSVSYCLAAAQAIGGRILRVWHILQLKWSWKFQAKY